jgi:hypothetical protein
VRCGILLVIFSLLTVAMLGSEAGSAQAVSGRTLYFKQTLKGQHVTNSVVARSSGGQIAVYTFPKPRIYDQYDGKRFWECKVGEECRVSARGAEAKRGSEIIERSFFKPWDKHGLASALMEEAKPSGSRTVAGIASSCKSSPSLLDPMQVYTLCVSRQEGFLTLLEAGEETWVLQQTLGYVRGAFLRIPNGVWDGHLNA